MTKRIVSILALCVSLSGYAMQRDTAAPLFSTYCGEQLTPESLPLLAPQLPSADLVKVGEWIRLFYGSLHELVQFQKPALRVPFARRQIGNQVLPVVAGNFGIQQQAINQALMLRGLPNKSNWNYIFDIPGTRYMAQIAGRLNRVKNLLVANDPNPAAPTLQDTTPDQLCDRVIARWPKTYQTVSRLATYLRAKEAVDLFHLDKVTLPSTYILGLEEDLPNQVNDDNSLIIQEKIDQAYSVRSISVSDRAAAITPEAVRQVAIVIIYASMWDINANLMINPFTRNFVISDFEQPNNSNPSNFFMKKDASAIGLARCGLGQLAGLIKDVPGAAAICQTFSQLSDNEMKQIALGTLPASIATRL